MPFGIFKRGAAAEKINKFKGNTDFLEACCAASALIAAADGSIDDDEVAAAMKSVKACKALVDNFDMRTIETVMNTMLDRAGGGRVGRSGLWTEIDEAVERDGSMAEVIVMIAVEVAEADGDIGGEEQKMLEKLAQRVSVDLKAILEG